MLRASLLIAAIVVALVAWISLRLRGDGDSPNRVTNNSMNPPIDESRFWQIVEPLGRLPLEERESRLHGDLAKLPLEEVRAFAQVYRRALNRAYTWELWGAGYVIMRGCSDDGFKEFRNWLISEGRAVFEAVLAEPDRIAEITRIPVSREPEFGDWPMLSELDLIPLEFLGAFDSQDPMDNQLLGQVEADWEVQPSEPLGEPWPDSDAVLAARYPRLWRIYGLEGARRRGR